MRRDDSALLRRSVTETVLEHRVLAVASLEPRHDTRDELGVGPRAFVDEHVLLVRGPALDALAHGAVEEREPPR